MAEGKPGFLRRLLGRGADVSANVGVDVGVVQVVRAYPKYTEGSAETERTHPNFKREYEEDEVEHVFNRDELANKLVRKLARDYVGKGFTIDAKGPIKKAIEEQISELRLFSNLYFALLHTLGRGRCALMIGTSKDSNIEKARDPKALISYLSVMHPQHIKKTLIEKDPKKPLYGDVGSILISRAEKDSTEERTIPRSRFIWMPNRTTHDDPAGTSVLISLMDAFTTKKDNDWSLGAALYKIASPLFSLTLPADADEEEFDEAKARFTDISARSEFVAPEGYAIALHGTQNVVNPKAYTDYNIKNIASGLDVPYQMLIGAAAGSTTGGELNLKDYYQAVHVQQTLIIEVWVRELITMLQGTGQIPEGTFKVNWTPLEEMDEKEKADIAKLRSDALVSAVSALPHLEKRGVKCRFVDGSLIVEDGNIKPPEKETSPTPPPAMGPQPGEPPILQAPAEQGPREATSLPPQLGGVPSGSPNVPATAEAGADQVRRLSRQERAELTEKYAPDTDDIANEALSLAITGMYEGIDEYFAFIDSLLVDMVKDDPDGAVILEYLRHPDAGRDAYVTEESRNLYRDVSANDDWSYILDVLRMGKEARLARLEEMYGKVQLEKSIIVKSVENMKAVEAADRAIAASINEGSQTAMGAIGVPMEQRFPLEDRKAIDWIRTRRELLYKKYHESSGGLRVQEAIIDGFKKGKGIPQIKKSLAPFLKVNEGRLESITRTEVQRAANEGALMQYKKHDVTEVEFLATPDEVTCDECMALDGRKFDVPDASGVIPVHERCRCTWVPVAETMRYGR